jgi:hypothetical protein
MVRQQGVQIRSGGWCGGSGGNGLGLNYRLGLRLRNLDAIKIIDGDRLFLLRNALFHRGVEFRFQIRDIINVRNHFGQFEDLFLFLGRFFFGGFVFSGFFLAFSLFGVSVAAFFFVVRDDPADRGQNLLHRWFPVVVLFVGVSHGRDP